VTSASSDVDFDDYGVFGYQLEPELLKIHEKYKKYIFRIIFYVSLIKNDKQKKEKKLTFLNPKG
jgi:hypothetical protein